MKNILKKILNVLVFPLTFLYRNFSWQFKKEFYNVYKQMADTLPEGIPYRKESKLPRGRCTFHYSFSYNDYMKYNKPISINNVRTWSIAPRYPGSQNHIRKIRNNWWYRIGMKPMKDQVIDSD